MKYARKFEQAEAMASRWRRRRICALIANDIEQSVALRQINGRGAYLDCGSPPPIGAVVELRHPETGSIRGAVSEIGCDTVRISFDGSELALAFALRAIASDMSCPL